MIRVNIEITLSKVFAFAALACTTAYSFVNSDPMPLTTALPSLTVLLGAKMYKDTKTQSPRQ